MQSTRIHIKEKGEGKGKLPARIKANNPKGPP